LPKFRSSVIPPPAIVYEDVVRVALAHGHQFSRLLE
jgi:hypothetical protein